MWEPLCLDVDFLLILFSRITASAELSPFQQRKSIREKNKTKYPHQTAIIDRICGMLQKRLFKE